MIFQNKGGITCDQIKFRFKQLFILAGKPYGKMSHNLFDIFQLAWYAGKLISLLLLDLCLKNDIFSAVPIYEYM